MPTFIFKAHCTFAKVTNSAASDQKHLEQTAWICQKFFHKFRWPSILSFIWPLACTETWSNAYHRASSWSLPSIIGSDTDILAPSWTSSSSIPSFQSIRIEFLFFDRSQFYAVFCSFLKILFLDQMALSHRNHGIAGYHYFQGQRFGLLAEGSAGIQNLHRVQT